MYFSIPVHQGAGGLVVELRHDAAVNVHSEAKRDAKRWSIGSEGCRVRRRHVLSSSAVLDLGLAVVDEVEAEEPTLVVLAQAEKV
eukprot:7387542-Prymnesium_polylepis.2